MDSLPVLASTTVDNASMDCPSIGDIAQMLQSGLRDVRVAGLYALPLLIVGNASVMQVRQRVLSKKWVRIRVVAGKRGFSVHVACCVYVSRR